eukprot:1065338-Rhodomonas_salina.4
MPRQLWSTAGQGWRIHATLSRDELHTILTALEHCFPDTHLYSVAKDLEQSRMAMLIDAAPAGRLHEPESRGQRTHHFSADHLQLLLKRLLDAPYQIEIRGAEKDIGVDQDRDVPLILMDFWLDQRRQGQPVPWSMSHSLPARTRWQHPAQDKHQLHPITAPGTSLLQNVSKIHSFDFRTNQYSVEVNTTAQALTRWGVLSHKALGRAPQSAPPIFIPTAYLPHHAASPSGRWWVCRDVRKAPTWLIGLIQWVFAGVWRHIDSIGHGQASGGLPILPLHCHPTVDRDGAGATSNWPPDPSTTRSLDELCPDNLLNCPASHLRKRRYRQAELESPTSEQDPELADPRESWTPQIRCGTRRVQPVRCTMDKRQCQPVTVPLELGTLIIAWDRVSMQRDSSTVWSVEKAKFRQWQTRYHLSDGVAATLGQEQHDHAMEALNCGARLPVWPYLMDIMVTHSLDILVGPSVFEALPYTEWCTSAENFEWGETRSPLILIDWIPPAMRLSLLNRARDGGSFVVVGLA